MDKERREKQTLQMEFAKNSIQLKEALAECQRLREETEKCRCGVVW